MKEKIYTIPLMDAFKADTSALCYIQRNLEQYAISFILGSLVLPIWRTTFVWRQIRPPFVGLTTR